MDAIKDHSPDGRAAPRRPPRASVVLLTLATAAVHASLGGPLFTLNASATRACRGDGPARSLAAIRWLVRLALLGFTAATIVGWLAFGARFPLAYVDKGIEVCLSSSC